MGCPPDVPIYVIGSEGYIGSAVQPLLASRRIIRVGNPRSRYADPVVVTLPNRVPREAVCVLLAAVAGEHACEADRPLAYDTNVELVRRICDLNFQKIILTSTTSLYGSTVGYATEASEVCPTSYYTQTKLQAETIIRAASPRNVVARLAIAVGASQNTDWSQLVNHLVRCAVSQQPVTIYGAEACRPYCDIRDIARALVWLLDHAPFEGAIVNVGNTAINLTKRELVQQVQDEVPSLRWTFVDREDERSYRVSFAKLEQYCPATFHLNDAIETLLEQLHHPVEGVSVG